MTGSTPPGGATPPKVVYVAGRGHSGSTLLDRVLSGAPTVEGVGELVAGMGRVDEPCACGRTVAECEVWADVRARASALADQPWDEVVARNQRRARGARFGGTWRAGATDPEVDADRRATVAVYPALHERFAVATVVDSSKEITRALFLARFVPEVVVVHLVRDPVDVLASDLDRIRRGHYRFQRRTIDTKGRVLPFLVFDAVAWTVGNVLVELVARRRGARVVRVRYEDLCTDPVAELGRLGEVLGLDLAACVAAAADGEAFGFGHIVAGNPMRTGEAVRIRPPGGARRRIGRGEARVVRVATWPLRRRYGYVGGR